PDARAAHFAARLRARLETLVDAVGLGNTLAPGTGFKLGADPDTVRRPDVAVAGGHRAIRIDAGFVLDAQTLAVEVISRNARFTATIRRVRQYLAAGTRLVWVVDPDDRSGVIFRPDGTMTELGEHDAVAGEDVLPGLVLSLEQVWV
ncbi:MAG TPA: Uma2 family endonuclease, partial [Dehalococcoidia bacterium]|nr:Uma2 family endonuclease [Dehalococcoidia bacterium]